MDKTVYLPFIVLNENEQIQEFKVITGKLLKAVDEETLLIETYLPDGTKQTIEYKKSNVCVSMEKAEKKLFDLRTNITLKEVRGNFPEALLPDKIKGSFKGGWMSGNPLRLGEPGIAFFAQSNTFGNIENPQKIIQMLGAIHEDIEVLFSLLNVLYKTNDYTKKLLGKYVIIEMNSVFILLQKLSKCDVRYKKEYYEPFLKEIAVLEKQFAFKVVRDKIAAHRDVNVDLITSVNSWNKVTRYSIAKYLELIQNHLNDFFLTELYPHEKQSYFLVPMEPFDSRFTTTIEKDYERFDGDF